MTLLDVIYAVAPWAALGIVVANWRPIWWLVRTLAGRTDGVMASGQPKEKS